MGITTADGPGVILLSTVGYKTNILVLIRCNVQFTIRTDFNVTIGKLTVAGALCGEPGYKSKYTIFFIIQPPFIATEFICMPPFT